MQCTTLLNKLGKKEVTSTRTGPNCMGPGCGLLKS